MTVLEPNTSWKSLLSLINVQPDMRPIHLHCVLYTLFALYPCICLYPWNVLNELATIFLYMEIIANSKHYGDMTSTAPLTPLFGKPHTSKVFGGFLTTLFHWKGSQNSQQHIFVLWPFMAGCHLGWGWPPLFITPINKGTKFIALLIGCRYKKHFHVIFHLFLYKFIVSNGFSININPYYGFCLIFLALLYHTKL